MVDLISRMLRRPLVLHVRIVEDVPLVASLPVSKGRSVHAILITESMMEVFLDQPSKGVQPVQVYDAFRTTLAPPKSRLSMTGLCCTGRLCADKGQHLLLAALRDPALRARVGFVELFGDGVPGEDFEQQLRGQIDDEGLGDLVSLRGFCEDVRSELSRFCVMAVPSEYEPLGRVILEAWESGVVPVVPATSGGAAEVIRESRGGVLARDRSPEELSQAIHLTFSLSDEERGEMVDRGRRWVREHLSVEAYRGRLTGILYD
ncbi:glycosyltransferase family 4 protein [bacterium]|nr:glycosyltransferase family 4 protein [bacterium]